jgi:hypothetical protein
MKHYFKSTIDSKTLRFVKPSDWTRNISIKIRQKFKIKNQGDIAKYILYYSQSKYDSKSRITFSIFSQQDLKTIESIFCAYLMSDKTFLKENKIEFIDSLVKGVEFIKKSCGQYDETLAYLFSGISFSFEFESIWFKVLDGTLAKLNIDYFRSKLTLFNQQVFPQIKKNAKGNKQLESLDHFDKLDNPLLFDYFLAISNSIALFKKRDLWIPSRFVNEIWEKILYLEFDEHSSDALEDIVFTYFQKSTYQELELSWCKHKLLEDKSVIIIELFKILNSDMFSSTIIVGLTIFDQLVIKILIEFERASQSNYISFEILDVLTRTIEDLKGEMKVTQFFPPYDNFNDGLKILQLNTLTNFLKNNVYKSIDFKNIEDTTNNINRHGILHGKLSNFGTKENALRIIILIDDLLEFYNNYINKPKQL